VTETQDLCIERRFMQAYGRPLTSLDFDPPLVYIKPIAMSGTKRL